MFPSIGHSEAGAQRGNVRRDALFRGSGRNRERSVDVDALSAAFDALLEAHPVLGGRLERGPDGRHQIVVDDLLHPGIEVVELDDPTAESPPYTSTRASRWSSSG